MQNLPTVKELLKIYAKVAIFWDIVPCSQYVNQHSSKSSVPIQTTWSYMPEDGNIHNCRYENLKSYIRVC
jgi:hypothetical protein